MPSDKRKKKKRIFAAEDDKRQTRITEQRPKPKIPQETQSQESKLKNKNKEKKKQETTILIDRGRTGTKPTLASGCTGIVFPNSLISPSPPPPLHSPISPKLSSDSLSLARLLAPPLLLLQHWNKSKNNKYSNKKTKKGGLGL